MAFCLQKEGFFIAAVLQLSWKRLGAWLPVLCTPSRERNQLHHGLHTHHPQMLGCFETPEGYFGLKMSFSSSWAVLPAAPAHGVRLGVSSDSAGCF